jgi:glyoxylase-like metal-dependent hydrolase (beta-lactamase superfamily II)
LDATINKSPLRNTTSQVANSLPAAKGTKAHPTGLESKPNASIFFVGTATTILEWEGIRLMTDPNFPHAGDHVHLGPGVSGIRRTNPALDLNELPRIDVVLLSHYHGDHFDQGVEA